MSKQPIVVLIASPSRDEQWFTAKVYGPFRNGERAGDWIATLAPEVQNRAVIENVVAPPK